MWGYIALTRKPPPESWVPSLYVRVYHGNQNRQNQLRSSLIICEGISNRDGSDIYKSAFPHYMWGYIGRAEATWRTAEVPSFIICEGISMIREMMEYIRVFPHYMWGYIDSWKGRGKICNVPSLYVRVYRIKCTIKRTSAGSLIICEGISYSIASFIVTNPFPHYMWGYIGYTQRNSFCFRVPSLYVRVYRLARHGIRRRLRSLIIYEYMSVYRNW